LQPGAFTFFSLSFALRFVVLFTFFFSTVFSLVLLACGDGIGGSACAVSVTGGAVVRVQAARRGIGALGAGIAWMDGQKGG
jgi:hypothetical protein